MIFYIFLNLNKSHKETVTNNELILLTNIITPVALGDVFFHYDGHQRCSCSQLTRAPDVYSYAAEYSPQQMNK